jgi:hypothetical protein
MEGIYLLYENYQVILGAYAAYQTFSKCHEKYQQVVVVNNMFQHAKRIILPSKKVIIEDQEVVIIRPKKEKVIVEYSDDEWEILDNYNTDSYNKPIDNMSTSGVFLNNEIRQI